MKVNVEVINIPGSVADWRFAKRVSPDELPVLTKEQKSIARDFGISEKDYARSVLGRRYAEARYTEYAKHFGQLLQKAAGTYSVESAEVIYDVWQEKFHCRLKANGVVVPISFSADIVVAPLERGESLQQAEKAVQHGVERALSLSSKAGVKVTPRGKR